MYQAPNNYVSSRSLTLLGTTIIVAGTIAFSIAGLQAATSQNEALETFSQKGMSNFRTMGSTTSRSVSESGTTYLMDDIKEKNREPSYLLPGELGSIVDIISAYPPRETIANDTENSSNLPENTEYAIQPNGSIINLSTHLMGSFTAGVAYDTSIYTKLEWPISPSAQNPDEIEVMAMTEQLTQLTLDLREIDKKYDGKIDNLNKDLDSKFVRLETKIETAIDKLAVTVKELGDKVDTINTNVIQIKTTMDVNNSWKVKFQIPLFVSLVVVIATAVLRVFIP